MAFKVGDVVRVAYIDNANDPEIDVNILNLVHKKGVIETISHQDHDKPYNITVRFSKYGTEDFCKEELVHYKKGQLKTLKVLYAKKT